MAEKRKDSSSVNISDSEKKVTDQEYLQRNDVSRKVCDCLLKLIENKPSEPMLFLANCFDSMSNDKSNKIVNAMQILTLTHHSQGVFQANLIKAYDLMSVPKSPTSKKSSNNRPGLIGSIYEELLKSILSDLPKDMSHNVLKRISCRNSEMVPFDIFRYGITVCFVYMDFIKLSGNLFKLFCSKHSTNVADKPVCDAILNSYKEAITVSIEDCNQPASLLEAGHTLSSDQLALSMLKLREDKVGKQTMSKNDFVYEMTEAFLSRIKVLK